MTSAIKIRIISFILIIIALSENLYHFFGYSYYKISTLLSTQTNFPIKIYVINLDKSPERLISITKELNFVQIPFERFNAVDYKELILTNLKTKQTFLGSQIKNDLEFFANHQGKFNISTKRLQDVQFIFDNSQPVIKTTMTQNQKKEILNNHEQQLKISEVACAYSHLSVMNEIVRNNLDGAIILEDDALLLPGFKFKIIEILNQIPKDSDIIYLDLKNRNAQTRQPQIDEIFCRIKYGGTGNHAYYVTNKGARKILKHNTVSKVIDVHFTMLAENNLISGYVLKKRIATLHSMDSTIGYK